MAKPLAKKLERALKAAILGGVARLLPRRVLAPPDWTSRPWRVLYLRYDRIGDMIMSTALIRAVAKSHPTIRLDVLASPSNAAVLHGNPHVRDVLVFNRRSKTGLPGVWRELRRRRYDVVIDGGVTAPSVTTMLLMVAARAPYRIGLSGRANDAVYTLPVPAGAANASFLTESARTAQPFGVPLEGTDWHAELFLADDERQRAEARWNAGPGSLRLLLNVSAFTADRRWPLDRSAALVAHLRSTVPDARILVTGDPGDWEAVRSVAGDHAEPVNVSPVREVFALVGAADALVTPDTSLSHAAAALGTPFAVLFRGDWLNHQPLADNLVSIVSDGSTLAELPLERAKDAMGQLLVLARAARARRLAGAGAPQGRPA